MKVVLLITVIESAIIAVLMILWRYRNPSFLTPVPAQARVSRATYITTPSVEVGRREALHNSHWAFINGWKVAPQSDDRAPAFGGVVASVASASGRRSAARRKHQAMYKEWSQDRHD